MDRRIQRIWDLVEEDSRNVHQIARLLGLSPPRTRHLFASETGESLRRFICRKRLERAASLIQTSDLQVKEVAFHSGFRHLPSFSRAFRRAFGVSPAAYRSRIG